MKIYTIKFYFRGINSKLPTTYMDNLVSFFHTEILGKNNKYHEKGQPKLYSISEFFGSKRDEKKNVFEFNKGAIWLIRTPSPDVFKDFYLKGKNSISKEFMNGMFLENVEFYTTEFDNISKMSTGSTPIYIGQNKDSKDRDHVTFKHGNDVVSKYLKQTFITKTTALGYNFSKDDFEIEFDLKKPTKTTPRRFRKGTLITTVGTVNIAGSAEIISLFYGLGIGLSTGCGFGFIFNVKQ